MRSFQSLLFSSLFILSISTFVSCGSPSRSTVSTGQNNNPEIESQVFELPGSHWAQVGIAGEEEAHYRARIHNTEISDGVVEEGKVLVYYKSGGKWEALPYTRHRGSYHFSMDFEYGNGFVDIMRFDSDQIPVSNSGNEGEYKIIVATADGIKKVESNSKNLDEVVASVLDLN